MRLFIAIGTITIILVGCQTAEQSLASAESVCLQAGLKPGTRAYGSCTNASYQQNVAHSNAAANAVATGAAAGLIGGAIIAAESRPYYGGYYGPYGYYGRGYCRGWGCY